MFSNYRVLFQRTVAFFGILNNSILALLILYKSPKKLGYYKFLMMYISIFEVIYSLLDFSTVPEIFSKDSAFLIVVDKNSTILPDISLACALMAFCSLFGMSMAIFAIHFVYRFLVITGSTFLQKNHPKKVIGLISFTVYIGIIWSIFSFNFLCSNEFADEVLNREYLQSRHLHLTEVSYMGPLFLFPAENGKYTPNFDAFVTIAFIGSDSLDPLPNFFIIKNFRQAILDFFGCGKKKPTPSSSNGSNPIQREALEMQQRPYVIESN